jgi:hypothetical protein
LNAQRLEHPGNHAHASGNPVAPIRLLAQLGTNGNLHMQQARRRAVLAPP